MSNIKFGKKHFPEYKGVEVSETQVKGNRWRAWHDDGVCYLEYDAGGLVSVFETIQISREDFEFLKVEDEKSSVKGLVNKYSNL